MYTELEGGHPLHTPLHHFPTQRCFFVCVYEYFITLSMVLWDTEMSEKHTHLQTFTRGCSESAECLYSCSRNISAFKYAKPHLYISKKEQNTVGYFISNDTCGEQIKTLANLILLLNLSRQPSFCDPLSFRPRFASISNPQCRFRQVMENKYAGYLSSCCHFPSLEFCEIGQILSWTFVSSLWWDEFGLDFSRSPPDVLWFCLTIFSRLLGSRKGHCLGSWSQEAGWQAGWQFLLPKGSSRDLPTSLVH